jgi:hypothetical protein
VDQSLGLTHISQTLEDIKTMLSPYKEDEKHKIGLSGDSLSQLAVNERMLHLTAGVSSIVLTDRGLKDVAKEQAIIKRLNFRSRPVRHDIIPVAHQETFQWALVLPPEFRDEDPSISDDDSTVPHLASWLRKRDGYFWISGKAGSGKSTLMKYIADNPLTTEMLRDWSQPNDLVVASHYFWSAGTPMQKTVEGLLRNLLYEIFRAQPALIRDMLPQRWAETEDSHENMENMDWTNSKLLEALQNVASRSDMPVRYCFFIDGIDEYDGDHYELCATLEALMASKNIKLCLSGRPWNVLEDFFGHDVSRKIYIHELTYDDIRNFTTSRLTEHPRWNKTQFRLADQNFIINEITSKAQGVFLWVYLVTNSLRDGLQNGDTMHDVRSRILSLPSKLEDFFRHMIDTVDKVYSVKTAHTLRLATHASESLYFLFYSMMENEYEDPDYALNIGTAGISEAQCEALWDQCKRQINARCGGLLEVKSSHMVEFLHRTVRDFLRGKEMTDFLAIKSEPGFSPSTSILRAYVAMMKCNLTSFAWGLYTPREMLRHVFQYSNDALDEQPEVAFEHLDELGRFAMTSESLKFCVYREEVLRAGLGKFISHMLLKSPNYFDDPSQSALELVLQLLKLSSAHIDTLRALRNANPDLVKQKPESLRKLALKNCSDLLLGLLHPSLQQNDTDTFLDMVPWTHSLKEPTEVAIEFLSRLLQPNGVMPLDEQNWLIIKQKIRKANGDKVRIHELKIFTTVIQIVVEMGMKLGLEMDFLVPEVRTMLPETLEAPLTMFMSQTPTGIIRYQARRD